MFSGIMEIFALIAHLVSTVVRVALPGGARASTSLASDGLVACGIRRDLKSTGLTGSCANDHPRRSSVSGEGKNQRRCPNRPPRFDLRAPAQPRAPQATPRSAPVIGPGSIAVG